MSLLPPTEASPPSHPRTVESLLADMTREEKALLLAGRDDWHFQGVPRFGVPSVRVADCGHGVTLCGEASSPATCFPTGIGMAATWNAELLEQAGRVIGREARALGCSILLGPKLNIHRHPLNGRSFETFSEDPWLAGLLGGAVIRGIQSAGVGACVKAMAANNQQKDQEWVSSEVDERTLREIYLRAFQIAIAEGRPCAIMTAYNRLNGVYCSESSWLINTVIKEEWKFPGFVVSDWRAVHEQSVYFSGLDLEMPGPGKLMNQPAILRALAEGWIREEELNDKAGRILGAVLRYGADETETANGALDTAEHRHIAREVAEESIVLLKNDGILPLDLRTLKRILVTGPNAAAARLGGGGSASVTPFYSISPLDGLREICGENVEVRYVEGCSLVGTMETISDHLSHAGAASGQRENGLLAEFFNAPNPIGKPAASWSVPRVDFSWGWASPGPGVVRGDYAVRFHGELLPPASGRYRIGVFAQEGCVRLTVGGRILVDAWDDAGDDNFEGKYQTHYLTAECELTAGRSVAIELVYGKRAARAGVRLEWEIPGGENRLERVLAEAQAADAVIVCAGLSNLFEGGAADRTGMEIPEMQRQLIERIAAVNPRTIVALNSGSVLGLPWEPAVPAILQAWYPGQEGGRALARILFGQVNPSGRLPDTIARRLEDHASMRNYPGDGATVHYEEGMSVGYRHFDRAGIEPHFPFGYGLSYTDFAFSAPQLSAGSLKVGGELTVTVRVKNTGAREGKTVVQLYLRPLDGPSGRPEKELRAFCKLALAPGEENTASFVLGLREWETFDPEAGEWLIKTGRYEILTGPHSRSFQVAAVDVF